MTTFKKAYRDRFESVAKRDFKTALIRLLEQEYKILGSRRILVMLADDLEQLHQEYFPQRNRLRFGDISGRRRRMTDSDRATGRRPRTMPCRPSCYRSCARRTLSGGSSTAEGNTTQIGGVPKSATWSSWCAWSRAPRAGRAPSGAEVALMMNRSLTTIGRYLRLHYERHKEVLPMKGYVLDQGSNPTHKGIIIELYEKAVSPADIVLKTGHTQEAVDRYIKGYDQVLALSRKKHDAVSISQITGRSINVIRQYLRLVKDFHPELHVTVPDRQPGKRRLQRLRAKKHQKK